MTTLFSSRTQTPITDATLIQQSIHGNQKAYAQLMDKHERLVRATIGRYIQTHDDAEEVFQDTFLRAYQALPEFRGDAKLSSWLCKIAASVSLNRLRSRQYRKGLAESGEITEGIQVGVHAEGAHHLEKQEISFWLRQAIERLPNSDSEVLHLFYFHERSIEEICQLTGLSESNIKSRLARARQKLKGIIEARFGSELLN
jgi:RNA polymerase sigma-70 factor (ECF subfamily)